MDEQQYKVVRQLDEVMPQALTSQKAGVSFDVRVYFRENEDGYRWASVAFLDRSADHKIVPTAIRRRFFAACSYREPDSIAL